MSLDYIVDMAQDSIYTVMLVVAPVMVTSFVIGIFMSFLQAIFQIHEQTFSFVPKLIVIMATLILFAPWMLRVLILFSTRYFGGHQVSLQ